MFLPDPADILDGFDRDQRYASGFLAVHAFKGEGGVTFVHENENDPDPTRRTTLDTPEHVLMETFLALDPFSDWNAPAEPECVGHPAGAYDSMGTTVYCDGSCR